MSGKNQFVTVFNWQSTNPRTAFLPNNQPSGSLASGTVGGAMASTNTIYTQIVDVSRMDNLGLEIQWTAGGTGPTGTISVLGSNSGNSTSWFTLTFNPALSQPAAALGNIGINLNQFPWKYLMLQYVNVSGTGTITAYMQNKDLN